MRLLLAAALFTATMYAGPASQRFVEGDAGSPVRVVIYEDLQCPDCADFRRMLDDKLLPKYQSKVAFEHRDFPLAKHAWALKGAIASRYVALTKPDLTADFRRYLMGHQAEINPDTFNDKYGAYAKQHGIDPIRALAALSNSELAKAVQSDIEEGTARGVAHTPTVLVNGQPFVETFSYEEVAKAIDSELAAAGR